MKLSFSSLKCCGSECVEVGYIYCPTLSGRGVESNADETFLVHIVCVCVYVCVCVCVCVCVGMCMCVWVCPARLKVLSYCTEPFTAQWSLYVPHSGHYMYRQFNIQQFYILPTQCIYVFCVDLRTNSDYFPIQR